MRPEGTTLGQEDEMMESFIVWIVKILEIFIFYVLPIGIGLLLVLLAALIWLKVTDRP